MNAYLITVLAYLAVLIGISSYRSFRIQNQKDFMVGGRSASTLFMVMTLIATWTGSGSLIGGAGLAYRQGFSELWFSLGAWLAVILIYWLAGRVRNIAEYTLPDLLEKRYNRLARILGSITLIIGCTTIVGYQFKGGAFVLELTSGIPKDHGILILAGIVILLTSLAGMKSIMSLDLLNGIMILLGICIALPLLIIDLGGPSEIIAKLPETHTHILGGHSFIWAIAVALPVFFLLLGEPSMYQKFFSAKDAQTARRSAIGWIIGIVLVDAAICTMGVLGHLKFPQLGEQGNAERIILDIARFGLPTWAGCILLTASMAIVFSTANSFLLAPATNITHDLVKKHWPNIDEKKVVIINRLSIVLLGALACLLLTQFPNVLSMSLTAYTMIGAALTPAILAAFFWKRVTTAGGITSILGGMIATIVTKLLIDVPEVQTWCESVFHIDKGELGEYIIFPPLTIAILLIIIVSYAGKQPHESKWKPFFS
jgi:SSS family solute:Na+ symporter